METEIALYDWATEDFRRSHKGTWERYGRDRRFEVLIYVNRSIDRMDTGINVMNDHEHKLLGDLYERGYLTGRAFSDAAAIFPNVVPLAHIGRPRLEMYKRPV